LILSNCKAKEAIESGCVWIWHRFNDVNRRRDFEEVVFELEKDCGVQSNVAVNNVKAILCFVRLIAEDFRYDLSAVFLIYSIQIKQLYSLLDGRYTRVVPVSKIALVRAVSVMWVYLPWGVKFEEGGFPIHTFVT
jgi:hypothetical protein